MRIALEHAERLRDRINQRPIEIEQFAPGTPGKYDTGHRLAGTKLVKLLAKLVESDDIAPGELSQTHLESSHRIRVREDLSRLLEGLVLVHGNEGRSGPAIAGYKHVITSIRNLTQHLAEMGTELACWNCPGRHVNSVHIRVRGATRLPAAPSSAR